jgi:anti-sigma regulatory factor (Ser/Thr protein kinase)
MEAAAGATSQSRDLPAVLESIGEARDLASSAIAGAGVDEATVIDLQLALSELVTNAVVHGGGGPITVDVTVAPSAITCAVASDGQLLPEVSSWVQPVDGRPSGRGLSIVRAVADAVTVDVDGDRIVVRCTFGRG